MSGGIYMASKTSHASKWIALREAGAPIISTWIDEAEVGASPCMVDLWVRCVREASKADALVVYAEPGDVLKGGYVEVGSALASGVPVLAVGDVQGSWVKHPGVTCCADLASAMQLARMLAA